MCKYAAGGPVDAAREEVIMEGKVNILLSLSVSQYDWIASRAAAANVSRSAYIRNLIECKINESSIKEENHGNKD